MLSGTGTVTPRSSTIQPPATGTGSRSAAKSSRSRSRTRTHTICAWRERSRELGLSVAEQRAFIRPDGKEKVTGEGRYTADRTLAGQLYARVSYADQPGE